MLPLGKAEPHSMEVFLRASWMDSKLGDPNADFERLSGLALGLDRDKTGLLRSNDPGVQAFSFIFGQWFDVLGSCREEELLANKL